MFRIVRGLEPKARILVNQPGLMRVTPAPIISSAPQVQQVRHIGGGFFRAVAGKIATRLAVAGGATTIGGFTAYWQLNQYFALPKLPSFPSLPDFDLPDLGSKLDAMGKWLKLSRKETGEEQEEVQDPRPEALKGIVPAALSAPLPASPPLKKPGYFGDGELMFITRRLIDLRATLNSIADLRLQLPTIVVIGAQSSGKSSVLEAIVGHEFLPKGNNMVTRKPLELTLIHTPNSTEEYGEFPQLKITNLKDFNKIREYIQQMNASVPESDHVADDPIQLRIYSPYVPDLSLVDLPGYIRVTSDKQPVELKNKIIELCKRYIQEPNIILAVSAADVDLANSDSIKESRKIDPQGLRTLGVLTKMDQIKPFDGVELLKQNDYRLGLGYIGVVNRSPGHGGRFEDADNYFKNQAPYHPILDNVGIGNLRERLVKILEEHMVKSLINMSEQVKQELEETKYMLKVDFNDKRISQEYFMAKLATTIKAKFYDFEKKYGKNEIRHLIRENLESKIFQILETIYWNDPDLRSPFDPKYNPTANPGRSGAFEDPKARTTPNYKPENQRHYLQRSLTQATTSLTHLGIGKVTTQLVMNFVLNQIESFTDDPIFQNQPEVKKKVHALALNILKTREQITSELVESNMKAFKLGVEISEAEWQSGYYRALDLLKKEISNAQHLLSELQKKHGKKTVEAIIIAIQNKHQKERQLKSMNDFTTVEPVLINGEPLPKHMEEIGREAMQLKSKVAILSLRHSFIKKNGWSSKSAETTCPEIYLLVFVEQIARTCTQSLYSELWDDFNFHFPPQVDEQLYYRISEEEKQKVIQNDPKVRRHLELQTKRDKLEQANEQLNELLRHYARFKARLPPL